MNTRRAFFRLSAAAGMVAALRQRPMCVAAIASDVQKMTQNRAYWCDVARRLAEPLLAALAGKKLRAIMLLEAHPTSTDRGQYTHLEGLGRLLAGVAPWFELGT